MPVETNIANLSQTAASNSPPGSESPTTIDDYHRQALAFIAQHRDGKGFAAEVDVASAATCDIGAANSMFVRITGTTTITSFGTPSLTGPRFVRFAGALTLTHNASSLILPGGANITTAAGDTCIATPTSGGWVVSTYERAARVDLLSSSTRSLSGVAVDFTSIPASARKITIPFSALSTNGTSNPIIQLGDSGGLETSGYTGSCAWTGNSGNTAAAANSNGFQLGIAWSAASVIDGACVLTLVNSSTNTWVASISGAYASSAAGISGGGSKSLSGTLDRVRITTVGGSDSFDGGSAIILVE